MFGFGFDRRTWYIILGILVVFSLLSMTAADWIILLLTLPAVIVAITFHEFAHAWMADRLGDTTPRNQGRLTLNPLSHLDPFGFVLLMFAHIGWGKPVQINPNNFTSNKSRKTCEMLVALAGPLMNFILAIIFAFVAVLIANLAPISFTASATGYYLAYFVELLIIINIGLGVFNLIPLPPLDGEKIFRNILPYRAQEWLDRNTQMLTTIFLVLWIFGILSYIVSPVITVVENGIFWVVKKIVYLFI